MCVGYRVSCTSGDLELVIPLLVWLLQCRHGASSFVPVHPPTEPPSKRCCPPETIKLRRLASFPDDGWNVAYTYIGYFCWDKACVQRLLKEERVYFRIPDGESVVVSAGDWSERLSCGFSSHKQEEENGLTVTWGCEHLMSAPREPLPTKLGHLQTSPPPGNREFKYLNLPGIVFILPQQSAAETKIYQYPKEIYKWLPGWA